MKDKQNEALSNLNEILRELLVDTHKVSINQWNNRIAPKLSELSMAIDGLKITARTFILPKSYFETEKLIKLLERGKTI